MRLHKTQYKCAFHAIARTRLVTPHVRALRSAQVVPRTCLHAREDRRPRLSSGEKLRTPWLEPTGFGPTVGRPASHSFPHSSTASAQLDPALPLRSRRLTEHSGSR